MIQDIPEQLHGQGLTSQRHRLYSQMVVSGAGNKFGFSVLVMSSN
jgi:hypothetical protein